MSEMYMDKDNLTNIFNENYLKNNYQKYIIDNPNSKFIMFDFREFKHINDTYGHDVGDTYLKLFAKILEENFIDSLVVRLHGDEFVVLTKYSLEEIKEIFNVCDAEIMISLETGSIPEIFYYNAGVVDAEHGIANTSEKADYMMYYAKRNNMRFKEFDAEIWQQKIIEDEFINSINNAAKNNEFTYSSQSIYNPDKTITNIESIYTRSKTNESIFIAEKYDFIRNNSQLKKIDLFNLQYLLLRLSSKDDKKIISFDYRSLFAKPDLLQYLKLLVQVMKLNSNSLIISINVNDIDKRNYENVIKLINKIKELGFNICLDKYSSKTGETIYINTPVNYIKFDSDYWKIAMNNPKADYLLKAAIDIFANYSSPTIPIFTCIEKESEYIYAKEITTKPILLSGNYLSPEKKIIFEKK